MTSEWDQQIAEAIKEEDFNLFSQLLAIAEVCQGHWSLLLLSSLLSEISRVYYTFLHLAALKGKGGFATQCLLQAKIYERIGRQSEDLDQTWVACGTIDSSALHSCSRYCGVASLLRKQLAPNEVPKL
jgi:hypothetical protein